MVRRFSFPEVYQSEWCGRTLLLSETIEVAWLNLLDLEIIFLCGFLGGGAKLKIRLFCNKQLFFSNNQVSFDRAEKPTGLFLSLIVLFLFDFIYIWQRTQVSSIRACILGKSSMMLLFFLEEGNWNEFINQSTYMTASMFSFFFFFLF